MSFGRRQLGGTHPHVGRTGTRKKPGASPQRDMSRAEARIVELESELSSGAKEREMQRLEIQRLRGHVEALLASRVE